MTYDDDPHLVNVQQERKKLERKVDDIMWEEGANDPRLSALLTELDRLRTLEEGGATYDPKF